MQLKPGTKLQNGKYEILKTLGQGGFGITYLAEQVVLHRKVAIKEFFMKEYCERDGSTSHVTLGATAGSKELVARFREKFIREAQMIAGLEHPNIVKIHDVFEENGTAYYVMEYLEGDSLSERVKKKGPLLESEALKYIHEVGAALSYLHGQNCLHFDVKPSNILVNKSGNAILIDFGVSKHYDSAGSQTSSTPVGISKGYAPLEQYQQNEISTFTPATDVYALGATLYTLLTGQVPPSASEVNEDGLPPFPSQVPHAIQRAIEKAMSPVRKKRYQTIADFMSALDKSDTSATTQSNGTGRSQASLSVDNSNEETYVIGADNLAGQEATSIKGSLKGNLGNAESRMLLSLNFKESIVLGWQKRFKFNGRSRRSEFNWHMLILLIYLCFALYPLRYVFYCFDLEDSVIFFLLFIDIPVTLFGLPLIVRRLHDINKSGWWVIVPLVILLCYITFYR